MIGQNNPESLRQAEIFSPEHITKIGITLDIEGEISGQENLSIEGRVQGKISLDQNNIIIKQNATVKAEIHAKNVHIIGRVEGNVFATEKVHIEKGGQMNGNIFASRITIEDGAQFKGSVKIDTSNSSSS
ncbi:MAG: polymer-forming cytoskeletal protein [Candidatus Aminicenantes bacterium]|nr:polymer-forming cytoskeletal protein [Candidatus Aminicenantes bacterium]